MVPAGGPCRGRQRLLDPTHELLAPDLVWSELGNVLWKKLRRGQLERAQARAVLEDLQRYPLSIAAAEPLAGPALEIATDLGRSSTTASISPWLSARTAPS